MVGGAFDGFDALRVFFIEFRDDFVEESVCVGVKSGNFLDFCAGGQFLQPTYFNLYAEFQQTVFAENGAQCADFITVASINGETAVSEDNSIGSNSWDRLTMSNDILRLLEQTITGKH